MELLVVVAVIGIISAIALPNILNARSSALDSAISLQEKNLNSTYKSVKAATVEMPTEQDEILSYLATNSTATFVPPTTMEGPEGTLTLAYNSATDDFSYNSPEDSGDSPPSDPNPSPEDSSDSAASTWDPQDGFVSVGTSQTGPNGEDEAWFDYKNNHGTAPGEEDYYSPTDGGLQFEPFRVNLGMDRVATITTQSGNTFTLDTSNPDEHPYVQNGDYQIHWAVRNGGISVSSVVNSPAES